MYSVSYRYNPNTIRFISNRIRIFKISIWFIRKGTIHFHINSDSTKLFGLGTTLPSLGIVTVTVAVSANKKAAHGSFQAVRRPTR